MSSSLTLSKKPYGRIFFIAGRSTDSTANLNAYFYRLISVNALKCILRYALCLIAATKSAIQPIIKHKPPIGVIGPITDMFSNPSKFLVLNRYRDPENSRIPTVNMINDTLMD